MRTAILLSGRMRTFWHNYKNVMENLIVPNNADVFIFAGGDNRSGGIYPGCSSLKNRSGGQENLLEIDERQYFTEKLGQYLKKMVFIEDDRNQYISDYTGIFPFSSPVSGATTPGGDHRHYYIVDAYLRQKKCNELRKQYETEHGFKYDAVVRLRSDMIFTFKLDLQGYNFGGNNLYVGSAHPPYGQGDAFYFGSPAIMDTISSNFVHEYGTFGSNQSDLMDFNSFLNRHNANRFVYNSNKMSFCERMDFDREPSTRQSVRGTTQCVCCIDAGPGIAGIEIPVEYDNEIAKQHNITKLRVFVI
jgi:hypothetical protein